MSRERSRARESIEYAAARAVTGLTRVLPWAVAGALGSALGRIAFTLDRKHRSRALEAVTATYPGKTPGERRSLAAASFAHLGRCLALFPHLARITPANVSEFVDVTAAERVREVTARGRGVIILTGHIGFWELLGTCLPAAGVPLTSIARPVDNARVNAYVDRIRSSTGQVIIEKSGAMRPAMRALREGGALGILMDQDAGPGGVFVDFLGRPASTIDIPARLAMRTGAAPLPSSVHRDGATGRYVLRIGPEVEVVDTGDEEADVVENTRRMNAAVAEAINEHPEQWLWAHRRWKTRPGGAEGAGAGESETEGG